MQLAEMNIARLKEPIDAPSNSEFVAALAPINALAEASPGFVWRLVDEEGNSSSYVRIPGVDDPNLIVNLSVWTDLDSLRHFVTRSGHSAYLRRRREWFDPSSELGTVCWWVDDGHVPSLEEAFERLEHLRHHGPSAHAWPMQQPFDPPS